MRRRSLMFVVVPVLSLLYSCAQPAPPELDLGEVAQFVIAQTGGVPPAADPCNGDTILLQYPIVLLPLNRELCLNCANIGWLLREWRRSEIVEPLVVVTSSADTRETCDYLRRERATVPVLVLDEPALPTWWPALKTVLLAEATAPGALGRMAGGPDGAALVAAWPSVQPQSSSGAMIQPPSP